MRRLILLLLLVAGVSDVRLAKDLPDFRIRDILVLENNFIFIQLENESKKNVSLTSELKEKIFLTIYINKIKRAEYKTKYLDFTIFKQNSLILFRTNFRAKQGMNIQAIINPLRIIKEKNYKNNDYSKTIVLNDK